MKPTSSPSAPAYPSGSTAEPGPRLPTRKAKRGRPSPLDERLARSDNKARASRARRPRREARPRAEVLIAPGGQRPQNLDGVMREVILPALLDLVLAPED